MGENWKVNIHGWSNLLYWINMKRGGLFFYKIINKINKHD